jgi:hypothetical protein
VISLDYQTELISVRLAIYRLFCFTTAPKLIGQHLQLMVILVESHFCGSGKNVVRETLNEGGGYLTAALAVRHGGEGRNRPHIALITPICENKSFVSHLKLNYRN